MADGLTLDAAVRSSGYSFSPADLYAAMRDDPAVGRAVEDARQFAVHALEEQLAKVQGEIVSGDMNPKSGKAAASIIQWRLERLDRVSFAPPTMKAEVKSEIKLDVDGLRRKIEDAMGGGK